jgi:hypothetical protein
MQAWRYGSDFVVLKHISSSDLNAESISVRSLSRHAGLLRRRYVTPVSVAAVVSEPASTSMLALE